MTFIEEAIISGFIGEVASRCIDVSWMKIKEMVTNRNNKHRNIESQIYDVIVNVLNQITCNKFENDQDKIYQAAEKLLIDYKDDRGDSIEAVRFGLQILGESVNSNKYMEFKTLLYQEISKNDYEELYRQIRLLQQDKESSKTSRIEQKVEKLVDYLEETNEKLNNFGISSNSSKKNQDEEHIEKAVTNIEYCSILQNIIIGLNDGNIEKLAERLGNSLGKIIISENLYNQLRDDLCQYMNKWSLIQETFLLMLKKGMTYFSTIVQDSSIILEEHKIFYNMLKLIHLNYSKKLINIPKELIGQFSRYIFLHNIDEEPLDLSFLGIEGICLDYARLINANLEGSNLSGASLVGARLVNADLTNANLEGADLSCSNLASSNWENACLMRADLDSAYFTDASLQDANLQGAFVNGTHFLCANMRGTYLDEADLLFADFTKANLLKANFARAKILGVNFNFTDLRKVDFSDIQLNNILLEEDIDLCTVHGAIFDCENIKDMEKFDINCLKSAKVELISGNVVSYIHYKRISDRLKL